MRCLVPSFTSKAVSVLLLGFISQMAAAQSMKPGLWETEFSMKSGSGTMEKAMGELQAKLAALPPDQRKMMEQMMAKQGVGMGPKANSVKVCITPEDAARMDMPVAEGNCQQKITQRSSSGLKATFSCSDQPPTSGESEVTFKGDTAYTGKSIVNTTVNGKPERMDMTVNGKWVAAQCGAIKPLKRN